MKKQLRLLSLFMFGTLMFTACNNQNQDPSGTEHGKVTFVLPGSTTSTTYAAPETLPGEADMNTIDIYMFEKDGVLKKIYPNGSLSFVPVGNAKSTTITFEENYKTPMNFYFVANGASADIPALTVGTTTEAAFKDLTTVKQNKANQLTTPIIMTAVQYIENVKTAGSIKVSVKRRVARIDLMNDLATTGFTVKEVLVSDARLKANLFNDTQIAFDAANIASIDEKIAVTDQNKKGLTYIYPTTLLQPTELSVVGTLDNGQQKILKVKNTVLVAPNKVYKLKVSKDDLGTFGLSFVMAEWDDDDAPVGLNANASLFASFPTADPNWNVGARMYEIPQAGGTFTFKTNALSAQGVSVTPEADLHGNYTLPAGNITVGTGVLTYAVGYKQDVTVTLPAHDGSKDIAVYVVVKDKYSDREERLIFWYNIPSSPYYPGTNIKPVALGGLVWAPVNVGATTINVTEINTNSTGYYFQWSRNVPFYFNYPNELFEGAVSYGDLDRYNGKFIAVNDDVNHDWLKADDPNLSIRDQLWTTSSNPCPRGWIVPTQTQLTKFHNLSSQAVWNQSENRVYFENESSERIYFPLCASLFYDGNKVNKIGQNASVWCSSNAASKPEYGVRLYFNGENQNISIGSDVKARGYAIRCVKQ